MSANAHQATLSLAVRDFDLQAFHDRKQQIHAAAAEIGRRYPAGNVTVTLNDVYGNISNALGEDRRAIDLLLRALATLAIVPKIIPMRGGTDGAALSAKGVFTPNYFTGAHNFHSRFEFLPVSAFVSSYLLTRQICLLAATEH